jgi:formylglycine-generating enzyme required for sulfatase activity
MLEYLDFEVKIERRRGKRCTVSVINSPAGQASGAFTLPFTQAQLALIKATIEKAVLRSKMPTRRAEAPEVTQMKDFGADLFRALFAEEMRACYAQSQAIVRQQGKGLRLKLRLDPSLEGLPWEFLYSQERRDFVTLSRYNPIVRYTELKMSSEPLRVTPPLRLLVVIASPQEDRYYASLDTEREKQRILAALADLQETGVVTVDFLEGANSFRRLTRLLRREGYHILHFVGHGDYDKEHQEGVLVMEDEDRRGMWVGAQSLGRLLRDVPATRLAILNACVGAVASPADPFSSVAASLVGVGVPAVIAMQFEITDGAAITLAHEFYTALADNFPVDAALTEARKQISFDDPDSLEWATPVLYMRTPDGMLFDLAVAKEAVATAREKAAKTRPRAGAPRERAVSELAEMPETVLVPAGPFPMGSTEDNRQADNNERPQHQVVLDAFRIGRYPVTNAQYAGFIERKGYEKQDYWTKDGWVWREGESITQPGYWEDPRWNQPDHPVVGISWYEAVAYCRWLSQATGQEFRLPTEAEWEKAARGEHGREWPWGNEFDLQKANTLETGLQRTTPVGQYSPACDSPYGAADMAGNVWEWCQDWFAGDYYQRSPSENPPGPKKGVIRVLRGGSWYNNVDIARCACRGGSYPDSRRDYLGFRVVTSPGSP